MFWLNIKQTIWNLLIISLYNINLSGHEGYIEREYSTDVVIWTRISCCIMFSCPPFYSCLMINWQMTTSTILFSPVIFFGPGLGVLVLNLASFPTKRANPSYFISWGQSRLVTPRTGVLSSFAGAGEGWSRGQHSSKLMLCLCVHYGLLRPNQPLVG